MILNTGKGALKYNARRRLTFKLFSAFCEKLILFSFFFQFKQTYLVIRVTVLRLFEKKPLSFRFLDANRQGKDIRDIKLHLL